MRYNLSADEITEYMMVIFLPWDFKILYGIICDTVVLPYMGRSPKRGYIILLSSIQLICLSLSAMIVFESAKPLKYIFFLNALCIAFVDVVIDGINCIQQRKDPINGAEDL